MPFSDPLADGPTIHAAATAALEAGATLETALEVCAAVSDRVPVVLMVYANMVFAHGGAAEFARRAVDAGAAGAIVPDLPLEEAEEVREALRRGRPGAGAAARADHAGRAPRPHLRRRPGLRLRRLDRRHDRRARASCRPVSPTWSPRRRPSAEVPVAVGFGIGTPEQAAQVGEVADGVIVGSRLVRAAGEAGSPAAAAEAVGELPARDARALAACSPRSRRFL